MVDGLQLRGFAMNALVFWGVEESLLLAEAVRNRLEKALFWSWALS